ncbi:MAG: hypothetical protein ACRCYY_04425 [Trueperaceae bacterium]
MLELLSFEAVTASGWFVALPILIAIDAWYFYRVYKNKPVTWLHTAIVSSVVFSAVSLPLMSHFFVYPSVTLQTIPMMILASTFAALAASYLATKLGTALANQARETTPATVTEYAGHHQESCWECWTLS